jgi:hypothetical protein
MAPIADQIELSGDAADAMRERLAHEIAFVLLRAAARIDTGYTLLMAKALASAAVSRDATGATVQVEVARLLAQRLDDWSEPVQIQFAETPNGWQMYVRACESQVAIAETIRARAMRQ